MKAKIKIEKEITLTTLEIKAKVRYWEDTEINGQPDTEDGDNIPCKEGELWKPIINIETGTIINWELGKKANVHYKVCDCCSWSINNNEGVDLIVQNEYVPNILCPKECGYGDFIIMDIDDNGVIDRWNKNLIYDLLIDAE